MDFLQAYWNYVLGGILVPIALIGYIKTKPKKAKKSVR
ncbi:hypothetical protein BCG9842_0050 (plasmid) [Bacillus cereus G9842]|uniref:Uncharacterized protein n=1 Tax=Bacillus cereus (strain G9842) TaxID=405531 RepID=B7IZ73_BACC2|nr:hypothetical protein BCG9842_0050 [Bacillus cereus G9842]